MKQAIIGIDTGSTNLKVCAFNLKGKLLVKHSEKTSTHYGLAGSVWFSAKELWESVLRLLTAVNLDLQRMDFVPVSLAVTGMGESFVALNSADEPIDSVMAWFDQRPAAVMHKISNYEHLIGIQDAVYLLTGMEASPIFTLPKLLYFQQSEPIAFSEIRTLLSVPGYITFKLCGEKVFDYSLASRTMMFDVQNNSWAESIMDHFEIPCAILPRLVRSGEYLGTLQKEVCGNTGLPSTLKVGSGGHDHFCGSLAAGILKGSRIVDSSGTAESIHGLSDCKTNPYSRFEGFRFGRYVDNDHLYVVGGIVSSGIAYEWGAKLFHPTKSLDELDNILIQSQPNASEISRLPLFLPHLRGSGAPWWDGSSRGTFYGIKETCKLDHLFYSVIEGLCLEFTLVAEQVIKTLSSPPEAILVTGGGSKNLYWQQLKANCIGLPLEITEISETTALGAALLAALASGIYTNISIASESVLRISKVIEPRKEVFSILQDRLAIYKTLYAQSIMVNRALQSLEM